MINRYFLLFRGNVLVILARSISEALEPWSRINKRSITAQEFESALIESPDDFKDCRLLLVGKTISKEEFANFQ